MNRSTRHLGLLIRVLILVGSCAIVWAPSSSMADRTPYRGGVSQEEPPPPPYIDLAQQALVDGETDVAVRVLKAAQACWVERGEKCGFTSVDYDSLAGVVYLERGLSEKAVLSLGRVVGEQPNRTMAWFYLGQAHMRLSNFEAAARALEEASPVGEKIPQYHGMLVRAWRGAKEPKRAHRALVEGLRCFPEDAPLLFEGTDLFLSQGLFLAARELAARHAELGGDQPDLAFLAVAEAYRKEGWLRETIETLEEATLLCGYGSKAAVRLAYAYAEAGRPLSAARIFEKLEVRDQAHLVAASEQYRLAGHLVEAERAAAGIEQSARRKTQLAMVGLQKESFDVVVRLLEPMARKGELDEQWTFRLAYAAMRAGRFSLAEGLCNDLKGTALAPSVKQLREALSLCRKELWTCW